MQKEARMAPPKVTALVLPKIDSSVGEKCGLVLRHASLEGKLRELYQDLYRFDLAEMVQNPDAFQTHVKTVLNSLQDFVEVNS